ncbi:MAG: adenine phosphoribosyltransferase [Myxococcota bacterium]
MSGFDPGVSEAVQKKIRDVPNFPKPGVGFKDVTPVLEDGPLFQRVIESFVNRYRTRDIDVIAAIESRGFLFGAPLAVGLGKGLVLLRKLGKLPHKTIRRGYDLEYGADAIEMHEDAIHPGQRVLVVDDVLATGGTMSAALALVRAAQATPVEAAFLIELGFLGGRKKLDVEVGALVLYP